VCVDTQDDSWRPVNYQNVESVHKFEADMKQLGIDDVHQYTHGTVPVAGLVDYTTLVSCVPVSDGFVTYLMCHVSVCQMGV